MRCVDFFCTFAKTIATMSNKTLSALKNNNLSSYLGIIGCCVGAAVTIAGGAYFSYLLPAGAVIISSLMCVMFAVLAFKPAGKILKAEISRRQQEQEQQEQQLQQVLEENKSLKQQNQELSDKIDIRQQISTAQSALKYTFKLELLEFEKKGYIVKEDYLDELEFNVDKPGWLKSLWPDKGTKKILFITKFYNKVSIGIDFTKIRYCYNGDKLSFYGVKFTVDHPDLSSEMEKDRNDIDLCEVISVSENGRREIRNDDRFNDLKRWYSEKQQRMIKEQHRFESRDICSAYTQILHESLKERFANIDFVDSVDIPSLPMNNVHPLNTSSDMRVGEITNTLLALTTAMKKENEIKRLQ